MEKHEHNWQHNWQPTGNSFYGYHAKLGEIPFDQRAFEFVCYECRTYTLFLLKYLESELTN